jgi:tetratricopeptide (TPR) repeat protein
MDLAMDLAKKDDHKGAIALLNEAIAKDPQESHGTALRLYGTRAREEMKLGNLDKALADAQQSINLHPKDGRTYLLQAEIRALRKDDEAARINFERAILLRPLLDQCWLKRGEFFLSRGRNEDALKDFEKAILLNPSSDEAAQDRFEVLRALGDYPKALSAADLYISMRPQYTKGYSQRADFEASHNDFEKAIKDYTYAIEIGSRTVEEKPDLITEKLSNEDLSTLYSARAEAFRKAGLTEKAKRDTATAKQLKNEKTSTGPRSGSLQ